MADVWAVGGQAPEPINIIAEAIIAARYGTDHWCDNASELALTALVALGQAGYRLVWDAPWETAHIDGVEGGQ